MKKEKYNLEDLLEIMRLLRSPEGCPWDREQTHSSLKKYLLEEIYEVIDVIETDRKDLFCEELGDLLLQIVFHSQIAKEEGHFSIEDVITGISKKMISRHTHVFAEDKADTSEDVLRNWEEIKKKEKGLVLYSESLKGVPLVLPALVRSEKIQKKASKIGFDWKNIDGVMEKIKEEISELVEARESMDQSRIHDELGDVLFSLVNLSRFLKVDPEFALADSTNKFVKRFELMEKAIIEDNKKIEGMSLEEMDSYWEKVKSVIEKGRK